jgi:hypothetical protein
MDDKTSATRGAAHEGLVSGPRQECATVPVMADARFLPRRMPGPNRMDVALCEALAGLWHIKGVSPAHLFDGTGDQYDGHRGGVLSAPTRCHHSGVASLQVLSLGGHSPESLEGSPEISFCPE